MKVERATIENGRSEIGDGMAGLEFAGCLSPVSVVVEVYSTYLREAEFEMVSLRFELSTAPRIG